MAPKPKLTDRKGDRDAQTAKQVDSDGTKESDEEILEEESERSDDSRKKRTTSSKKRRDKPGDEMNSVVRKLTEVLEKMVAQKTPGQSNKPIMMLDGKKLAAGNEETSKELNKIMDSCRSVEKRAASVPLINVVKSGEEVTVANKLRALAPKLVEDILKRNNLHGNYIRESEFLELFTYQDLFDAFQQGGLEKWNPSTFIKLMPKDYKFGDTLDVLENFPSFYSSWLMTARTQMRQIPHPLISEMVVTRIISVFPEDLRRILNAKRETLKRSDDKQVQLSADDAQTYLDWVNELTRSSTKL